MEQDNISSSRSAQLLDPTGLEYTTDNTLTEEISLKLKALRRTPKGQEDIPTWLTNAAISAHRRYAGTRDLTHITETISLFRKAVYLTPEGNADMSFRLNSLGMAYQDRFQDAGDLTDLTKAISSQKKAIHLTPEQDAELPARLNDLGISSQLLFTRTRNPGDIDEAITFQRKAIELIPEGHPGMAACLNTFGNALRYRFEHTRSIPDLSEAISLQQQAIRLTPEKDRNVCGRLNNLAESFRRRFERTNNLTDLGEAISLQQRAIRLTPEGHANMPDQLHNLGNAFRSRYRYTGDLTDIDEAISLYRQALYLLPSGHADIPVRLDHLAMALRNRFEQTRDFENLREALSLQQRAVHLTPNMPLALNNLGMLLRYRSEATGNLNDLEPAISFQQKCIQLLPETHNNMPYFLNSLANSFLHRFNFKGDHPDLAEAVSLMQKAIRLSKNPNPLWLTNLGMSLRRRFEHTGNLTDLAEAIFSQRKAIDLTPERHASMPSLLNSLGISLYRRFERTGEVVDLKEATSLELKAIGIIPEKHAEMPSLLNSLGNSLFSLFRLTGDLVLLDEALSIQQKAVRITPKGHSSIPGRLANLGVLNQFRFDHTGDLSNLDEAISLQEKAIQLTPEGHIDISTRLNNLGNSCIRRFQHNSQLPNPLTNHDDLDKAIDLLQQAIRLTPLGHADLIDRLTNMGIAFETRFVSTRNRIDIEQAICNHRQGATYSSGSPFTRLDNAKRWARLSEEFDLSQSLDAYQAIIHLLSQVAGMEQIVETRYAHLLESSELSTSAAAAAFRMERYDLALEWLEQGRCLVWNQLNQLRTPLDMLRDHNPHLADQLSRISKALETAGSRTDPALLTLKSDMAQRVSSQDEVRTHVKQAQEWEKLLGEVRSIPGFESFLKPASCSSLLEHLPESGPIVVINIDKSRSDALALVCGADTPLHIPLPKFSYQKAANLRDCLKHHLRNSGLRTRGSENETTERGMRFATAGTSSSTVGDILQDLWIFLVKPILDALGYSDPPPNLARIWWCATGPLAFLPIHAAGIYTQNGTISLSDFAISSYIPTVTILSERMKSTSATDEMKTGIFIISQPETRGLPRISSTVKEAKAIERLFMSQNIRHLWLDGQAATVNQSIENMETHSCIHLACHASQLAGNPLKSAFYLYDGQLELSAIIKKQLVGADFAFLSACQTSTGDESLSEEAVHLAAGMLAAGYRGVVATMWSIRDKDGPNIAEDFYTHLLDGERNVSGKLSVEGAARALHYSTQNLRKSLGDSDSSLLAWIPYIHFGF